MAVGGDRERTGEPASPLLGPVASRVYSGRDRAEVLAALRARARSDVGPARLVVLRDGDEDAAGRWLAGGGPAPCPPGVAYRDAPLAGQVAFVYTNAAASYAGMGEEFALAFPEVVDSASRRTGMPVGDVASGVPARILGAGRLAIWHTEFCLTRWGLRPEAAIGYSSGEATAPVALGAWRDSAVFTDTARDSLFTRDLSGEYRAVRRAWRRQGIPGSRWSSYLVLASAEAVRVALAGRRAVHLLAVTAPDVCVVGGESEACAEVVRGMGGVHAIPVDYPVAAHAPELVEVRDRWWRHHHRSTTDPGVRFYGGAAAAPVPVTAEGFADALTAQAVGTVRFAEVVERAWADGVRFFLEQGPGAQCTAWISRVLAGRDHLAVALDGSPGRAVRQLDRVAAELLAAGLRLARGVVEPVSVGGGGGGRSAPAGRATGHAEGRADGPVAPEAGPEGPPVRDGAAVPVAVADAAGTMLPAPWVPPAANSSPVVGGPVHGGPRSPAAGPAPITGAGLSAPAPGATRRSDVPASRASVGRTTGSSAAPRSDSEEVWDADPDARPLVLAAGLRSRLVEAHRRHLAALTAAHHAFLRGRERGLWSVVRLAGASATQGGTLAPGGAVDLGAAVGHLTDLVRSDSPAPEPWGQPVERGARGAVAPSGPVTPSVPLFGRAQLERMAIEPLSRHFGPLFAAQDRFSRWVRLPSGPLLLVDRVTGLDGEPGTMGLGSIRTETDVRLDSWCLDPAGRMTAGMVIEAGQADLLLISWLGVDLLNRGERVYRLLGCEVTFHGPLPRPGETLRYDIHVDRHAEHAGTRLFFFHYDCHVGDELRVTVREARAGFFTDEELAGVGPTRWEPERHRPSAVRPVTWPLHVSPAGRFDRDAVLAWAEGRPVDCFGPGWALAAAHVRTPRITDARTLLLGEVTELDPHGGPWGAGYLRAETPVRRDDWFFDGHFPHDPCMAGSLILEGCLQAMAFHLTALGLTLRRDGWRFEPVTGRPVTMRCRGQVTPDSARLRYEVFVSSVTGEPEPALVADVVCWVDGVMAFHARDLALRLVPDWPLDHWRHLGPPRAQPTGAPVPLVDLGGLRDHRDPVPPARWGELSFGYAALLTGAWGRPSEALGPGFAALDARRTPRFPGPPYNFLSRVTEFAGDAGDVPTGLTVEYDAPHRAWYFEQNGCPTMPMAALMEVALQGCGVLAVQLARPTLVGSVEVFFRNLDGEGTVVGEVRPGDVVATTIEVTNHSRAGEITLLSFSFASSVEGRAVFTGTAVFGFFPEDSFQQQPGLPASQRDRDRMLLPGDAVVHLAEWSDRPGALRLAGPMLRSLDRVTGFWPEGGSAGLGRLRAEKDIVADAWYFKAHFFQDPVQPGSLGVEAMCQLLQYYLLRTVEPAVTSPRFEPVRLGHRVNWRYRGQVLPTDRVVTVEMDVLDVGVDERGVYATAEAWLWVDGRRIYHVRDLGMRIVEGDPGGGSAGGPGPGGGARSGRGAGAPAASGLVRTPPRPPSAGVAAGVDAAVVVREEVLDPATDGWLDDHRPTWVLPALPMMSTVDRLAGAVAEHTGERVLSLRGVQLRRWTPVTGPLRLRTSVARGPDGYSAELAVWREARTAELSRFEPVATSTVRVGARPGPPPEPFAPLVDAVAQPNPYESGALFHGPSFHYLRSLSLGSTGASAVVDPTAGSVPRGHLHQGVLDTLPQAIPHQELWRWAPEVSRSAVCFPHRVESLDLFGEVPDVGRLGLEVRFVGFPAGPALPTFDIQLTGADGAVLVAVRMVDVLVETGLPPESPLRDRRAFLHLRRYAGGLGLSRTDGEATVLSAVDVDAADLLPGTVAGLYGLPPDLRGPARLVRVAVKDHLARRLRVHPSEVVVAEDNRSCWSAGAPERCHRVGVCLDGDRVEVRDA
ncbi:hypothetical protein [Actinoalloteichus caeruleus]|uniref:hypothetical protein n=1 Tax=Actinoalloteichus cyanogriseus TaxID=2893586 RepID=UPI003BB8DB20